MERPARPTVNEVDIVKNSNEIPLLRNEPESSEEYPSNVLMSHAGEDSIFNKTEVLAGQYATRMENETVDFSLISDVLWTKRLESVALKKNNR